MIFSIVLSYNCLMGLQIVVDHQWFVKPSKTIPVGCLGGACYFSVDVSLLISYYYREDILNSNRLENVMVKIRTYVLGSTSIHQNNE